MKTITQNEFDKLIIQHYLWQLENTIGNDEDYRWLYADMLPKDIASLTDAELFHKFADKSIANLSAKRLELDGYDLRNIDMQYHLVVEAVVPCLKKGCKKKTIDKNVKFISCYISLDGAKLTHCDFRGNDLWRGRGADFTGSNFNGAFFAAFKPHRYCGGQGDNHVYYTIPNWVDCNFTNCSFMNACHYDPHYEDCPHFVKDKNRITSHDIKDLTTMYRGAQVIEPILRFDECTL